MKQNDVKEAFRKLSLYISEVHQKAKTFFPEEEHFVENMDRESFTFTLWQQINDEGNWGFMTHSLEYRVKTGLEKRIKSCIAEYRFFILPDMDSSEKVQKYETSIIQQVNEIFNNEILSGVKFLSKYKDKLVNGIREISDTPSEVDNSSTTQKTSTHNLLTVNREKFTPAKIKELHQLLATNTKPFIEYNEEEFIKAFSDEGIVTGVKWLVKTKGIKFVIKTPLFYLMEQLREHKYIYYKHDDLKQIVFTLFRDEKGEQFGKSLGTSVSTHNKPKKKPLVRKNDIDSIIFQLSLTP